MATPDQIAKQFVDYYYSAFDSNRANLSGLYVFAGSNTIIEKLTSLPFTAVKHIVATLDAQPASESTLIVMVTGALAIDDSPPMQYSQVFHLVPEGGSYFVFNDIFRLNLG
ncbi:Nuclear transport factor 2 [Tulasnella sp. 427]|nr:Nuclear transport factor 2 [Tulasnella sp. 427]